MKASSKVKVAHRRRRLAATATAGVALFLVLVSVAWACTLQVGTLTVCRPPSDTYQGGGRCGQKTGSGGQIGLPKIQKDGSDISVVGTEFSGFPTVYSIHIRRPGSSANCHRINSDAGVTSLLGSDALGLPNTVPGPNFNVGNGSGTYPTVTTPAFSSTGSALVCVQDFPEVVDGNQINLTVV
ncbi:MAG: hypothetical protein ACRDIU_11305 [Actinomycetota bacterium]